MLILLCSYALLYFSDLPVEQESELTVEAEEDRIDRALEVDEKIQQATSRIDGHNEHIGGDTAVVTEVRTSTRTLNSNQVDGLEVHGETDGLPESIEIEYLAPDGSQWETTLKFPTTNDAALFRLLDKLNIPRTQPSSLINEDIPVVYTGDEWRLHLPPQKSFLKPSYLWSRFMLNRGWFKFEQTRSYRAKFKLTRSGYKTVISAFILYMIIMGAVASVYPGVVILIFAPALLSPMIADVAFNPRAPNLESAEQLRD